MGGESCRQKREETCSLEQASLPPAFKQPDGNVDYGDAGNEAEMQNKADNKVTY